MRQVSESHGPLFEELWGTNALFAKVEMLPEIKVNSLEHYYISFVHNHKELTLHGGLGKYVGEISSEHIAAVFIA